MEANSDNRVLKILPKINTILTFYGHANSILHRHNTSYNTGVAVQDNAAQQWWYSTILTTNTISNTGKFAKMVHPDFFDEGGGRSSYHFDLEN